VADSFPRQKARTRNFTLGAPRSFQISSDGRRIVFLRSPAGDDPATALWVFDLADRRERCLADPADLLDAGAPDSLSPEERARRERARETAGGIVSYSIDDSAQRAVFVLGGRLFLAELEDGAVRELQVPTPVFDPRLDPSGQRVAFVHDRALFALELTSGEPTRLAGENDPAVSWGLAEFIAAEEMERARGYWWSPGGEALLAARVDESPVEELWIAAPVDPAAPARSVRYPRAGTPNARVEVHLLRLPDGSPTRVTWEDSAFPYLVAAHWDERGPMIVVQSRDQRRLLTLAVDPASGQASPLADQTDADWMDVFPRLPRRLSDGRPVTVGRHGDVPALLVDGRPVTPPDLEIRGVLEVDGERVLFAASREPVQTHVFVWELESGVRQLTSVPGVHTAVAGGELTLIGSTGLDHAGTRWTLGSHRFESRAETPLVTPEVRLLALGARGLRSGLLLPTGHESGRLLPVLLDPYGGPHFQRVAAARSLWLESQWLADQGFAVLVCDGRGTPGRGLEWSRAVRGDLAGPPLADQVEALEAAGAQTPELDLTRVAIRGWSYGGYLAALAVLRRPDVFHAAVAGAPVTDWRLYDTHYTERYLGTEPDGADRAAYERSSILADAASLRRPLLLIHGLADDNVLVAHTLQLSQRLTESGRLHSVLPLSGITHMTPQELVAENLLKLQVEFLHQALSQPSAP
jgi:dipeptidyl-peptidase-4